MVLESKCRYGRNLLISSLLLVVTCTWLGPEPEWNNPYDPNGTNPAGEPVFTMVPEDTSTAINDTMQFRVEAESENAEIIGYLWSFDGGTTFDTIEQNTYSYNWSISDSGVNSVQVHAINEWGMISPVHSFKVIVHSYAPFIKNYIADSTVNQMAEVERTFAAGDTNGTVDTYFWGTGSDGWDDSATTENGNPVTKTFSNKDGGPLAIRWKARDSDGLEVCDTFLLLFNRGPDSVWLVQPSTETGAPFLTYNIIQNSGKIQCVFTASDPDSFDTIIYSFFLGTPDTDTNFFYQGSDTVVFVDDITPETTYRWMLTAKDKYGDSCESSGEFVSGEPPAAPDGMVLLTTTSKYFHMGQSGFDPSEEPIHLVGFSYHLWIDATEVTNKSYAEVLDLPYEDDASELPVVNMSWYDAVLYCNARSKKDEKDTVYQYETIIGEPGQMCTLTGLEIQMNKNGYRLPTEAEWEYACRLDSLTLFYWGNDFNVASEYAWTRENSNNTVHEVAIKKQNEVGLYDMSGNVWEWCNDWYDPDYYSISPSLDPTGPSTGEKRIIRGGSWQHSRYFAQAGTRIGMFPESGAATIGFRTVMKAQ